MCNQCVPNAHGTLSVGVFHLVRFSTPISRFFSSSNGRSVIHLFAYRPSQGRRFAPEESQEYEELRLDYIYAVSDEV